MKKVLLILLSLGFVSLYASDYDADNAQMLSMSCTSCHGTDGKSSSAMPSIAKIDKDTLYKILIGYKNGTNKATMMQKHVKGFTDKELEQISYYFSKIK